MADMSLSRILWLVQFEDGEEYFVDDEDQIVEQFGESTEERPYKAIRGMWVQSAVDE